MSNSDFYFSYISNTINYGLIGDNSTFYSSHKMLGKNIKNYRLKNVIIYIKNEIIFKIILKYQKFESNEILTLFEDDKNNDINNLKIEEFNLKNSESIINMKIWLNIKLIGVEFITNLRRQKKFGKGNIKDAIFINDFLKGEHILIGLGYFLSEKDGVTSLFGIYINKSYYYYNLFNAFFCLRKKLKDDFFKKQLQSKIDDYFKPYRAIFKLCLLPDVPFFNILKFISY